MTMIDITTNFCSIELPNPFILASGPPTSDGRKIIKAFENGWGGAIVKTLKPDHLEVVDVGPRFAVLKSKKGEIIGFQNIELVSTRSLDVWLEEIKEIKKYYPAHVLIGSIMADIKKGSWQDIAYKVQKAGVDAIELNFSCPHGMPEKGVGAAIGQNADLTEEITRWVKEAVDVPVIVKLTPNVTDITEIAKAALKGGADAISAINTVQCLIGIDLNTLEPLPSVDGYSTFGGYSGIAIKPIGLRAVAQIAKTVSVPILATGGVSKWEDAVEYFLVGACAVQVCTQVMLEGYGVIHSFIDGLKRFLMDKDVQSVRELIGLSLRKIKNHSELSLKHKKPYIRKQLCRSCLKCMKISQEVGCNAIKLNELDKLEIDYSHCDGCSLCAHVCPYEAISMSEAVYSS